MPDQQWPFSKPLEFLQRIKYGGAVGKQIAAVIVALLILGVSLICTWGQIITVYFVVPAVIIVLGIGLFSVHRTLDKHPNLAILEGAEFVEFHRLEIAAKNVPPVPILMPSIPDPSRPPGNIEESVENQES
jgi:hypothetical protein